MPLREEMVRQGNFLFKHRSYLPVIILLMGLAVYIDRVVKSDYLLQSWSEKWEFFCLFISILGLLVRVVCIGYSDDNTSGRNTTEGQIAEKLNRSGMYAMVRHPLYLGNFLMWLGIGLLSANTWFIIAFVFIYWVYYERIMMAEEEYIRDKFGVLYEVWASETPAFIPDFGKWTKPSLSFSFIKVVRQEKAGILNLVLVFFIFKNAPKLFLETYEASNFWTYAVIIAVAWYIIIKLLQKTTDILAKDR